LLLTGGSLSELGAAVLPAGGKNRQTAIARKLGRPGSKSCVPRSTDCVSCVPKVTAARVSVASRVVNPKHDELRPAVCKELHQLHRKLRVYKMSNSWKVLTQFYRTLLYTQLHAHIQNC